MYTINRFVWIWKTNYDGSFPVVFIFCWSPKFEEIGTSWALVGSNDDVFPALNVWFKTSGVPKLSCVEIDAFLSPNPSCLWLSCGSLNAPWSGKPKSIFSSSFFVCFSFPLVIWLISSSLASGSVGSVAAIVLAAATAAARNCLSKERCVADAGRGNEDF